MFQECPRCKVHEPNYAFTNCSFDIERGSDGKAKQIFVAGDLNGWKPTLKMKCIKGTNLWYYRHNFAANARFEYKFVVDGNWILDPLNKKTALGGYGKNSACWIIWSVNNYAFCLI